MMDSSAQQLPPDQNINQPQSYSKPPTLWPSKTIIATVGIVVLLIIGGIGGYFLGIRKNQTAIQNQQSITTSSTIAPPSPTPTPTPDPIAHWKTYANAKHGFEIRYPITGKIVLESDDSVWIDLVFAPGTTIFSKYLKIKVDKTTLINCLNPADLIIKETSTVYINGIEITKVTGLKKEAGFTTEANTLSRRLGGQCFALGLFLDYNNPAPSALEKDEEATVFAKIISTLKFTQ